MIMMLSGVYVTGGAVSYYYGDVNNDGVINSADALALSQHLIGATVLEGQNLTLADIDGNGIIDSGDYLAVQGHLVGILKISHRIVKDEWEAVPFTSAAQVAAGIKGGEGCQWPTFISFDSVDGSRAFLGTDVGGLYRSTDGGVTWEMSAAGFGGEGATSITVDSNNIDRVLACGVNSAANANNGLYLSTDGGVTWKPVLKQSIVGNRDYRDSIAFDKSSYSDTVGGSAIVYWLKSDGTLYRSLDGGETWNSAGTYSKLSDGEIFVNPSRGYLYAASSNGFYVSKDNGLSFTQILSDNIRGIDVIDSKPNNVYLCSSNGIYISTDNGSTFTCKKGNGYPTKYPSRIEVSRVDPNYMVIENDMLKNESSYSNVRYYSHDGGNTWHESVIDSSLSAIPYNIRSAVFAFHPTDKNICISTGGDMVLRSVDGGSVFQWSNSGYNGAAITSISYNVNNPNLMYCGNQDYSGFYSTDSGKTWKYIKWYLSWGGFTYGGYVLDENTVITIRRTSWNSTGEIYTTYDGGSTVKGTGVSISDSNATVTGCPGNNNIVFCGKYRTYDRGKTWSEMNGCESVYGSNPSTGELYGKYGNDVVRSADCGVSWSTVGTVSDGISEMTYDQSGNRVLVISDNKFNVYVVSCTDGSVSTVAQFSSARDGFGGFYVLRDIAVDPLNSNVIYLGNARQTYASDVGCLMSTDGGATWQNLASTRDNVYEGADGGREVTALCVNPLTRELFAVGSCRGIYKRTLPDN